MTDDEPLADELPGGAAFQACWHEAAAVAGDDPHDLWNRITEAERQNVATAAAVARRRAGEQVARDGVTVRGAPTGLITAADLLRRRFAEQRWAVRGVIPEGLTVLASKPKLGKSWLVLGLGVAVAGEGKALGLLDVDAGPVLVMALEDTLRRLQGRLVTILDDGADPPRRLEFVTTWRRLDAGGLEDLRDWLTTHPGAHLVVVDTLARIRPDRKRRETRLYDDDYNELVGLKALADEFSVAIVVVHHLRKAKADDVIDQLNGTTGTSGAADAILILERGRGETDAKLHVQGRDVEEASHVLRWSPGAGTWAIVDPVLADLTAERAEMVEYLAQAAGPRTPTVAAVALGRPFGSVKRLMWSMAKAGQLKGGGRQGYYYAPEPNEPWDGGTLVPREPSEPRETQGSVGSGDFPRGRAREAEGFHNLDEPEDADEPEDLTGVLVELFPDPPATEDPSAWAAL
jgi:hypothetical protein